MENVDEEVVSLHKAAAEGNLELVKSLLSKSQSNAGQSWGAWLWGGVQAVDEQNSEGQTALHCAAESGRFAMVELLLERGAQIELRDNSKQTALHCAARAGHNGIVTLLLDKKAQIDVQDNSGDTPLHCAAHNDKVEAARLLLERGAQRDMLKAFKLLLNQKVQDDSNDNNGQNRETLSAQRPLLGIFSIEEIREVLRKLKPASKRKLKQKNELTFQKEIEEGIKALKPANERELKSKEHELTERQISMQEQRIEEINQNN